MTWKLEQLNELIQSFHSHTRRPNGSHDFNLLQYCPMQDLGYAKLANLDPINGLCEYISFHD